MTLENERQSQPSDETDHRASQLSPTAHAVPWALYLLMLAILSRPLRYARWAFFVFGEQKEPLHDKIAWDLDPYKMLMGGLAFLIVLALLRYPTRRLLRFDLPLKLLGLLVALAFLSLAWSYAGSEGFAWAFRLVIPLGTYFLIRTYTERWEHVGMWARLFAFLGLVNFAAAAYEILFVVGHVGSFIRTFTIGGGKYIFHYATWAVVGLAFATHCAVFGARRFDRTLGALSALACVATVFITFRRAAVLSSGALLVMYMALIGHRRRASFALMALAVGFIVGAILLTPAYARRLATIPLIGGAGLPGGEHNRRVICHRTGLRMFREHWLYGLGIGSVFPYFDDVIRARYEPHNVILRIGSELGLAGLLIYTSFVGVVFSRTWQAFRYSLRRQKLEDASLVAALLCALTAMMMVSMVQNCLYDEYVYMLAALGSAAHHTLGVADTRSESP